MKSALKQPCFECYPAVSKLLETYDDYQFPESWNPISMHPGFKGSPFWSPMKSLKYCERCGTIWLLKYDCRERYYTHVESIPESCLNIMSADVNPDLIVEYIFREDYVYYGPLIIHWSNRAYLRDGDYSLEDAGEIFLQGLNRDTIRCHIARDLLILFTDVLTRFHERQYDNSLSGEVAHHTENFDNTSSRTVFEGTITRFTGSMLKHETQTAVTETGKTYFPSSDIIFRIVNRHQLYAGMNIEEKLKAKILLRDIIDNILGKNILEFSPKKRAALSEKFGKKYRRQNALSQLQRFETDVSINEIETIIECTMEIMPKHNEFYKPLVTKSEIEMLKSLQKTIQRIRKTSQHDESLISAANHLRNLLKHINKFKMYCIKQVNCRIQ